MKDVVIYGHTCSVCGELHVATYPWIGFIGYVRHGYIINESLPGVSIGDKRFLLEDICPDCQTDDTDEDEEDFIPDEDVDVNEVDEIDWLTNNGLN